MQISMSWVPIFSTADCNPLLAVRRQVSLIRFAVAGDLALDLFSEFQGMLIFSKISGVPPVPRTITVP